MGVEGLADCESRRVKLPVTRGDVVGDDVAEHVILGGLFRDALGRRADHHAELDLIVKFLGDARVYVVMWTGNAGRLLVEPELLAGRRHAEPLSLLHMLFVIHADGQVLARPFDRCQKPSFSERRQGGGMLHHLGDPPERLCAAGDDGQHGRISRAEPAQPNNRVATQDANVRGACIRKPQQAHLFAPRACPTSVRTPHYVLPSPVFRGNKYLC